MASIDIDWAVGELRLFMINDETIWKDDILPIYKSINKSINKDEDINFVLIQRQLHDAVRNAERFYRVTIGDIYLGASGREQVVKKLYQNCLDDIKSGYGYLE